MGIIDTDHLLAMGSRILAVNNLDDFNQGQISCRVRGTQDEFMIKNAVCAFHEMSPEDVSLVNTRFDLGFPPSAPAECVMHKGIYSDRPDVNAIVHIHGVHSLAFGATELEVEPVSHDGAYFAGRCNRFFDTSNAIITEDKARLASRKLDKGAALFLVNHGSVIVADSIRKAVIAAVMLERACQIQLLLHMSRARYHVSRDNELAEKRGFIYSSSAIRSYWNSELRRAARLWPEVEGWARI